MLEELKEKLQKLNSILCSKNNELNRKSIREYLINNDIVGIKEAVKLNEQQIREITDDKGIVSVDGSINNYGGLYPHYVSLIRAVALGTKGFKAEREDIYTPLLEDDMTQEEDAIKEEQRCLKWK
ncbi:hypothetical protein PL321_06020 [Caloramator sp. mosi_1]|uniref:hypothetical protein n=1 Tax=Caloramator sp. mosi_1 TaxID=3023090 RepID=UPI002360A714|nr:hypothetical protein [Caloramator sp. mosi_1]WDC85072.1 hypothetical protein PL321_06020 [Caloramator sp. mosi_1]